MTGNETGTDTTLNQNVTFNEGWRLYNERSTELKKEDEQVKMDFIAHTRSIREIEKLPPDERPAIGCTCVDERTTLHIVTGNGDLRVVPNRSTREGESLTSTDSQKEEDMNIIRINTLAGGTEFLEDSDIRDIILMSNGNITINSHRLCGWGEVIFEEILKTGKVDGYNRINKSIGIALQEDDTFRNAYKEDFDSLGLSTRDFLKMANKYVNARFWALEDDMQNEKEASVGKVDLDELFGLGGENSKRLEELILQAFVHGKTLKLRSRFHEMYQKMINVNEVVENLPDHLNVVTVIDKLEEASSRHTGRHGVINMTQDRVVTSRFPVNGSDAYFARVGTLKAFDLTNLLFNIMEGSHSETQDDQHIIHIFFDDEASMNDMENRLKGLTEDNETRRIVFHLINEEEIQKASPLPSAV